MNGLVKAVRRSLSALRRTVLRIQPVNINPYATHQPVLIGLSLLTAPIRIAEFGSGDYSTGLFLNLQYFPLVESVESWDNDEKWAQRVIARSGDDHRLRMHVVGEVAVNVPDLDDFDVAFIDDSMTYPERARTISAVKARAAGSTMTVLHDFEHRIYRRVSRGFDHRYVFRTFTPQVMVAWQGDRLDRRALRSLDHHLRNAKDIPVTDASAWYAHLTAGVGCDDRKV